MERLSIRSCVIKIPWGGGFFPSSLKMKRMMLTAQARLFDAVLAINRSHLYIRFCSSIFVFTLIYPQ